MVDPAWLNGDARARDAWESGPVQLEICSSINNWDLVQGYGGAELQETIDSAVAWHGSVVNLKYLDSMPAAYWPYILQLQRRLGYRFVLNRIQNTAVVSAGDSVQVTSDWSNTGIAPVYRGYRLVYRIRSNAESVVSTKVSTVNLTTWLPGSYKLDEKIGVPIGAGKGVYNIDVGILAPVSDTTVIRLAIIGRRSDGWYTVSTLTVE